MRKIGVTGSVNMDYFVETNRFPKSGETVLGESFFMSLGGKGASQAVAASRLGGEVTIVNPAPAHKFSRNIIEQITYLTPHEHEYEIALDSFEGMTSTLKNYPNKLIITRGKNGVKYSDGEKIMTVPVISVDLVDTTGAGDTFCGAFAVAIAERKELFDSILFENVAAGLSVMKKGAQSGMACRNDVDVRLKEFSHEYKDQLTTD